MGFYGKILQQVQNGFQSLKFSNKGKNQYDFPIGTEDIILEAGVAADRAVISSGNAWIGLVKSMEDRNGVMIYHNAPNDTTELFETVKLTEQSVDAVPLAFGDTVSFGNIEYDTAGHIAKIFTKDYILPSAPDLDGISNINDTLEEIKSVIGMSEEDIDIEPILEHLERLDANIDKIDVNAQDIDALNDIVQAGANNLLSRTETLENLNKVYDNKLGDLSKVQVNGDDFIGIADIIGQVNNLKSGEEVVWGETDTLVSIILELQTALQYANATILGLDARLKLLEQASQNL